MTLIATFMSRYLVSQASDRVVSLADGDIYDRDSNKAILFLARNALVSMSYAGIAYIDGVPTDQFIASILTNANDPLGFRTGENYRKMDIGLTMKTLSHRIGRAISGSSRLKNQTLCISAAGWQWKERELRRCNKGYVQRYRMIPIHILLEKNKNNDNCELRFAKFQRDNSLCEMAFYGSGHYKASRVFSRHPNVVLSIRRIEDKIACIFEEVSRNDSAVGKGTVIISMTPYNLSGLEEPTCVVTCEVASYAYEDSDIAQRMICLPFMIGKTWSISPTMCFAGQDLSWRMEGFKIVVKIDIEPDEEGRPIFDLVQQIRRLPPGSGPAREPKTGMRAKRMPRDRGVER